MKKPLLSSDHIVTNSLGFPLSVTIKIDPVLKVLGTYRTFENAGIGKVDIGTDHEVIIKYGIEQSVLVRVAAHEAFHLFKSVEHLICVDEETQAEVFGGLVGRIVDFCSQNFGVRKTLEQAYESYLNRK